MTTLVNRGLVAEQETPSNKRFKFYAITPDGEFAFALFFSPPL